MRYGSVQEALNARSRHIEMALDAPSGKLNQQEKSEAERSHGSREEMPAGVFLESAARKYPVKVKREGEWIYSRDLLLAAAREARMHKHEDLAARADAIRKREFKEAKDEWSDEAREAASEARKKGSVKPSPMHEDLTKAGFKHHSTTTYNGNANHTYAPSGNKSVYAEPVLKKHGFNKITNTVFKHPNKDNVQFKKNGHITHQHYDPSYKYEEGDANDAGESYWTYKAASPTPINPPPGSPMTEKEWSQLSPGMRREIWRGYEEKKNKK